MPLRDFLRIHHGGNKSDPRPSNSPTSPKSPKSPAVPAFSKIRQNPDHLDQCAGCDNIERLIRQNIERCRSGGGPRQTQTSATGILHNSFAELDDCAHKCKTCRLFRQALVLEEVTFDGVSELRETRGEVIIRWEEATATNNASKIFLHVELHSQPRKNGVVNCTSNNEIGHTALRPNALDPVAIEQAKGWLDVCLKTHIGQCDNLRWSSENPRLLIDILSPTDLRLCENQQGEYVALSYCWGVPRDDAEKNEVTGGMTLLANVNRRLQGFSINELPTTVREALQITYAMGVRLAWVDAVCIVQNDRTPDGKPRGVDRMHLVYSNALFTLCACATTRATAKLLDQREAWSWKTEPCRLGGQWLTTPDMSLNELRLRSPLAGRAWTLQEERLSPRMLYVTSSRLQWCCATGREMEMTPTYANKPWQQHRPTFTTTDRNTTMPSAQEFLLACLEGTSNLHVFWADIVKSYAARSMTSLDDRLIALSGLAAKYLSANPGDEYLAGLWANNLADGLAWKLQRAIDTDKDSLSHSWPSWSWAVVPLETVIENNYNSPSSSSFQMIGADGGGSQGAERMAGDAVSRGEHVQAICVSSRKRNFWKQSSRAVEWSNISRLVQGEEKFTFSVAPEQDMHAVNADNGRILVYESRKREVVGQVDFHRDVRRILSGQMELYALELGVSTMLLIEHGGETWRRVGVAWDFRKDYFAPANVETLVLR